MSVVVTAQSEKAGQPREHEHSQRIHSWTTRRDEKKRRMQIVSPWMTDAVLRQDKLVQALEALVAPADRVVLEGNNQKQADFLSRSLVQADPKKLYDLHLIISSISRPEHLELFELGIAKKVDFAFAGPQSIRIDALTRRRRCGDRRDSHLRRVVRSAICRLGSERRAGLCGTGRSCWEPIHGAEHGGDARDRRSRSFPRCHCDRSGESDCASRKSRNV